jgi:dihydroorotase
MTVDLTIKNCKLWFDKKLIDFGLAIDEGIIKLISKDANLPDSDEKIDCKGGIVLPGLIDTHVHFREPGMEWKEDWSTGSKAAAKGGITFVLDMPNTKPPTTTKGRLEEKKKLAEKSVVNFGLYIGIGEENLNQIEELAKFAHAFKIYMTESTGELKLTAYDLLVKAFSIVSKTKRVLCLHAEDQRIIEEYSKKNPNNAYFRPPEAEIAAIKQAIEITKQTGVKAHICHVTTKGGLDLIRKAKTEKLNITCETCPHYLFMTEKDLKEKSAFIKINPPLRSKKDQMALWKGISDGTIDIIASDHAPHTYEEKSQDISNAPSGVPGVETTLQLMLNAVNKRIITLEKLVKLMHDNPIERFDLVDYGKIETGITANLTIIDLKKPWKISRDELLTKCKWSPYEGWKGKGMPIMTIINGNIAHRSLY